MAEESLKEVKEIEEAVEPSVETVEAPPREAAAPTRGRGGRGMPRRPGRRERPRAEFDHKIVDIKRVARVVAGGRRFSFSVALVLGDRKGSVGVGLGKGSDTALAIEKATRDAKKNMIKVPLSPEMRIAHDVRGKHGASDVLIIPSPGRGLVAGSSVRTVLELAGVTDVAAKILSRSKNRLNNARAAVAALRALSA